MKPRKKRTRHERSFVGLWVDPAVKDRLRDISEEDRRPVATVVLMMIEKCLAEREAKV